MICSRVSSSVTHRSVPLAASSSHRGSGSGNGRPKTSPKYLASQVAECLTKPRRLVPVAVMGRRMSYSESPSSFQTSASRIQRRSSWRYPFANSSIMRHEPAMRPFAGSTLDRAYHRRGRGRQPHSSEEKPMRLAPARRGSGQSSDVAELVRLHHRRRGWAWVAIGGVIGLVVYAGIGANPFGNLTGTAETFSVIPVLVLLALVLAGLVVVIVDTLRIRRADAAVRVSAKGSVSHYPLYAHAHRYPPRHHGSWVFAILLLVAMTGIAVFILPAEVNSWAYVAGAENQDTFNPGSYSQACNDMPRGGGCHTVTEGYLSKTGANVTWGSQVPLGQPFSIRDPLWAWGSGRNLTSSDGTAIETIIAGLFFDGITLLLLYVVVVLVRHTSSTPSQRMPVPAGTDPGGVRWTDHPVRGHHGSGVRRPAR